MRSSTGRLGKRRTTFSIGSASCRYWRLRVRNHNHILLTGQRRMGKTSVAQELGRRLETKGWIFLFADVEGAACAEDAIAEIAQAVHPVRHIAFRFATGIKRWLSDNIEEISAYEFRARFRGDLHTGNWRRQGERLLRACAKQDKPVLLVIDELPIFLKRLLRGEDGFQRADEFLSWLRGVVQALGDDSLVLIVSGSIGLAPLVKRLGIPDRINHLDPFRLGPWDRDTSIECFQRLAENYELRVEDGVAEAVYDALGVGIPHHVQSFFARLRNHATMQGRDQATVKDVGEVYRTELLGASGQNDLVHYETRLKEALEDESHTIAMEILAEAATQKVFTLSAQHCLEGLYAKVVDDAPGRIADTLEILMHDGYLETSDDGYLFPSHLLKDWWSARFRDHHKPLESRRSIDESQGGAQ